MLPEGVFNYFGGCLDKLKANNLNLVCLVRCVRYIDSKIKNHNRRNICSCFKFRMSRRLLSVLDSRGH